MKTLTPSEKLAELVKEVEALDRKDEAGTLTVKERGRMDLLEEKIANAKGMIAHDKMWAELALKYPAKKEA